MTVAVIIISVAVIIGLCVVAYLIADNKLAQMKNEQELAMQEMEAKRDLGLAALRNDVLKTKINEISLSPNRYYANGSYRNEEDAYDQGFEEGVKQAKHEAARIVQWTRT